MEGKSGGVGRGGGGRSEGGGGGEGRRGERWGIRGGGG